MNKLYYNYIIVTVVVVFFSEEVLTLKSGLDIKSQNYIGTGLIRT